jgi:murein DD-endopeptidase MepM/ murein hydrolase activator NlpD
MRSLTDLVSIFCVIFCISFVFPIASQADNLRWSGLLAEAEARFFPIKGQKPGETRQILTGVGQQASGGNGRFFTIDRDRPAVTEIDPDAGPSTKRQKPVEPPFTKRATVAGGVPAVTPVAMAAETDAPAATPDSRGAYEPPANGSRRSTVGLAWPVDTTAPNRISSRFGWRKDPFTGKKAFHAGLDIAAPKGTLTRAVLAARVKAIGEHPRLGRYVMLEHGNGLVSLYGHLSEMLVGTGDVVAKGDPVGRVGSTGRSTGPHLDFSLELHGKRVDPMRVLKAPVTVALR